MRYPMEAINFLTEWVSWLYIIIPAGAVTMVTYQATRKTLSDDEGVISDCNTKIRNTIIGTVIALSLASFIEVVKRFYF